MTDVSIAMMRESKGWSSLETAVPIWAQRFSSLGTASDAGFENLDVSGIRNIVVLRWFQKIATGFYHLKCK